MASAISTDKLFCNHALYMYDHDPADSTVATNVAWVDMRDFSKFAVLVMASSLAGTGVTVFTIEANTAADGSGTEREIKAHAVGSAPDAVGDFLVLECTAEEIAQIGAENSENLRYVSAQLTCNNAGDEAVVVYMRSEPRFPRDGLTADVVA